MKIYCMVNKLKPEHVADYKSYHENAHKTEWKSQIKALKDCGCEICNVYLDGDNSIVIMGCEDLGTLFANMAKNDDNNRWQALMADFFAANPKWDGTDTRYCEKIFDLNEQDNGFLDKD